MLSFQYFSPFTTAKGYSEFPRVKNCPLTIFFFTITTRVAQHLAVCDFFQLSSSLVLDLLCAKCSRRRRCRRRDWPDNPRVGSARVRSYMETFIGQCGQLRGRGGWAWHAGHSNEATLHMQHVHVQTTLGAVPPSGSA